MEGAGLLGLGAWNQGEGGGQREARRGGIRSRFGAGAIEVETDS